MNNINNETEKTGKMQNSFYEDGRVIRNFSEEESYDKPYAITRRSSEHNKNMVFDINLNVRFSKKEKNS